MNRLTLPQIRRLAAQVALEIVPRLEVFATTSPEGADYTEVIFTLDQRLATQRLLIVGVRRSWSEGEIRDLLRNRLQDRIRLQSTDS